MTNERDKSRAVLSPRSFARRLQAWNLMVALALTGSAAAQPVERWRLAPLSTLTGARQDRALPATTPAASYLQFIAPTAVAARNGIVYVGDTGLRRILRYDTAQQTMTHVGTHGGSGPMTVASDLSLYVADTEARSVLHLAWDGRTVQRFSHPTALARPVGIALDEANGLVMVADGLYRHIAVFNTLGRLMATLKPEQAGSIDALASGPDGLYLVDRTDRRVVVVGLDGIDRYTLGDDVLNDPLAIAVDRFNRVFVSDGFDNTIKVFAGGTLAATMRLSGAAHGVTSLHIDRDLLYVADSLHRQVQAFRLPTMTGAVHD